MNQPETAWLVLGHPSCPKALTQMAEQLAALPTATPVRLVFPPVTPEMEETLEAVLRRAEAFARVECAANDWGTLARLSAWKQTPGRPAALILGVLLSGQDSDPMLARFLCPQPENTVQAGERTVLLRWAPPPDTLWRHWAEPAAFHWTGLLKAMGVDAVELGLQPLPLAEYGGPLAIRQLPYGVLSVQPCRGDCARCGGPAITRAGCRVFFDKNLLVWNKAYL